MIRLEVNDLIRVRETIIDIGLKYFLGWVILLSETI